jgi:hypothetical protein
VAGAGVGGAVGTCATGGGVGVAGAVPGTGGGGVAQPAATPKMNAARVPAQAPAKRGLASWHGRRARQTASAGRGAFATPSTTHRDCAMGLLLLEALAALGLLIFIVWWVMFAGRRKGERDDQDPPG